MREGIRLVRGMRDRLPSTQYTLAQVVATAKRAAELAQYHEIATPIVETTALFTHAVGADTDVVNKEMFSFPDGAKQESVSLRPEGTAGVLRAALGAKEWRSTPLQQRLYYSGPMFRRERPQRGRYRQFDQFGVENYGCTHPHGDAEVIALGYRVLSDLGVVHATELQINSLCDVETRTAHHEELVTFLEAHSDKLSTVSQARLADGKVLRILDSKDANDRAVVAEAPRLLDVATDTARQRFDLVLSGLDVLGVPYRVNHQLVRGLDYYTSTVWEFTTNLLGAQSAVLAGGRYDGLSRVLGADADVPAVGWAAGVDRLALLQAECGTVPLPTPPKVSVIHVRASQQPGDVNDDRARSACLALSHRLQSCGVSTDYSHEGSTRKQLARASEQGSQYAILIGPQEVEDGTIQLKHFESRSQVTVPFRLSDQPDIILSHLD
eukprot:m.196379 g.196379  ORF g.196379 m.196379 type:complete len:438 (-) comp19781_c0_seq1:109-1422(-)